MQNKIYTVNKLANRFFEEALRADCGKRARGYIKNRGISEESVVSFKMGYSHEGRALEKYLKEKGCSGDDLVDAGLFGRNDNGTLWFRFPKRLTLPIRDIAGNILGFGARILGPGEPKYLNTPETDVFRKRSLLYGLKAQDRNYMILCEGYMDVIALHEIGFTNAVASLGTALTEAHVETISSLTKNVILMYDMDKAGRTATEKAIALLRSKDIAVYVGDLSPAKDPDEYIRAAEDPQPEVLGRIRRATPAIEFLVERMAVTEEGNTDFKKATDILLRNCSTTEIVALAKKISKKSDR